MNDTTVETPAAEAVAETPQETPVPEAAEQIEQVEQVEQVEQPTVEEVQQPSKLEDLLEALGEIPDKPSEALLENLNAKSVENLPDRGSVFVSLNRR